MIARLLKGFFAPPQETPEDALLRDSLPPSIARVSEFLKVHRFSDLLPYERFDATTGVFENDDSYGFVLDGLPLSGASESVATMLGNLFNNQTLPEDAGIQVMLWGGPHILPRLAQWADRRLADADIAQRSAAAFRPVRNDNIYRRIARRRVEYLLRGAHRSLFRSQPFLVRDFRLVVSVTVPTVKGGNAGGIDPQGLTKLLDARDGMASLLSTAGIASRVMDADGLINLLDEILNPVAGQQRRAALNWDDGRLLKHQIVSPATRALAGRKGLAINDTSVRCYSVRSYPRSWPLWQMGELIGDSFQGALQMPCPFLLTLGVTIPRQADIRRTAQMRGARATQNAESRMAKYLPEFSDKKRDWDIMLKAIDEGHGGVRLYHQLVTFSAAGEGERTEQAVKALYSTKGWEMEIDSGAQIQALLGALPMTLSSGFAQEIANLGRLSTKTTRNAGNMMPVIGEWQGSGTPTLMLIGRRGQIQFIDLFDAVGSNYNVAIAAASRSGKSFLLNEIAYSYISTGGRVWIIDIGRSYEKVCQLLGGQFVEFGEGSRMCLNPFTTLCGDNPEVFAEQVAELKPIVAQMALPSRKTDDLENAWIEQAINSVWTAKGVAATMTDVAGWLESHDHPRARELGQALYPYTRDGVYARFFEGPATLDFDNPFIVLELEELNSKPDLQASVLLLLMMRINQSVYLGREDGQRKVCIIDEAWDLFGGENSAAFIEKGYRRIAKYGGAFLSATQGVNDYYKTPAALAAWENSGWVCLLRQTPESIEQLERSGRFQVDSHMKRVLLSLTTVPGQYADILVRGPQGFAVGRLVVDPYSALLYSSKNEDFIRVRQLQAEGLSVADAIDRILSERGVA